MVCAFSLCLLALLWRCVLDLVVSALLAFSFLFLLFLPLLLQGSTCRRPSEQKVDDPKREGHQSAQQHGHSRLLFSLNVSAHVIARDSRQPIPLVKICRGYLTTGRGHHVTQDHVTQDQARAGCHRRRGQDATSDQGALLFILRELPGNSCNKTAPLTRLGRGPEAYRQSFELRRLGQERKARRLGRSSLASLREYLSAHQCRRPNTRERGPATRAPFGAPPCLVSLLLALLPHARSPDPHHNQHA